MALNVSVVVVKYIKVYFWVRCCLRLSGAGEGRFNFRDLFIFNLVKFNNFGNQSGNESNSV